MYKFGLGVVYGVYVKEGDNWVYIGVFYFWYVYVECILFLVYI